MTLFDDKSIGGIIGKFDNAATPTLGDALVYRAAGSAAIQFNTNYQNDSGHILQLIVRP